MMTSRPAVWVLASVGAAALAAAAPGSAIAESIVSSASSTASFAASSASNSIEASSDSSSKTTKAAAGDYRIEAITVAADRPGMVRLALRPAAPDHGDGGDFVLVLPQRTVERQALVRGDTLSARQRAYGLEFARADTQQAFFLVLADAWHQELEPRPLAAPSGSTPRSL
jgi:hypothetical protein